MAFKFNESLLRDMHRISAFSVDKNHLKTTVNYSEKQLVACA